MPSKLVNELSVEALNLLPSMSTADFLTDVDVYSFKNPPENVKLFGTSGENCRIIVRHGLKFLPNTVSISCYLVAGCTNNTIVFLGQPGITNLLIYGHNNQFVFSDQISAFHSRTCAWNDCSLYVGPYCSSGLTRIELSASEVSIGRGSLFADDTLLQSHDGHGIVDLDKMQIINQGRGRIDIGERVWIGRRATILKDVTVGDGAIIAASAVANRDVAPFSLVAGVPAKVVKQGVSWSRSPHAIDAGEREFYTRFTGPQQADGEDVQHAIAS